MFYKESFSFGNAIKTTLIGIPTGLILDTVFLLTLNKPNATYNIIKNGYTYSEKDHKNITILGNTLENILSKEAHHPQIKE